jgi:thioredoxin-like negative regulator of GroEL
MVNHYSRLPAATVLVVAIALGALYLRTYGRQNAQANERPRLEALIASQKATAKDWLAYADLLCADKTPDYAAAAEAYRHVLDLEHYNDDARQGRAVCLAKAGKTDDLYAFLGDLVLSKPKLAVDLLEDKIKQVRSEPRFEDLYKDAKAQAMD